MWPLLNQVFSQGTPSQIFSNYAEHRRFLASCNKLHAAPINIMSISGGNCSISLLLSSCKLYSLHIKSLVLSIYIYIKKATLILEPSKSIKLLLIIIDCVIDHRSQCITANNTFFLAYVVNPSC